MTHSRGESAGPKTIRVSNLREFDDVIAQFRQESQAFLLFRGQTRRFVEPNGEDSLRPALCRSTAPPDAGDRDHLIEAFGQYLLGEAARGADLPSYWTIPTGVTKAGGTISIFDVNAMTKVPLTWVAVLQHYGFPTEMLDVTADPDVALAFGLWPFAHSPTPLLDKGVMYVFSMAPHEKASHVELGPIFPWDDALRPVRQSGSLLCGLYEDGDPDVLRKDPNRYARHLAAVLVLENCEGLRNEVMARSPRLTEGRLFPSNVEDRLHRFFLDAQRSGKMSREYIHERKGDRKGVPLFNSLPVVEPLTGRVDVAKYATIRASKRFPGSTSRVFIIANIYAGGSPAIHNAQANVASILSLVGEDAPLEKVLSDNLDQGASPLSRFDVFEPAAFGWFARSPRPPVVEGIDDRNLAQAHADEFAQARAFVAERADEVAQLYSKMCEWSPSAFSPEVASLDSTWGKIVRTSTVGDSGSWISFVQTLVASAKLHRVSLDPYPVLSFFNALGAMTRASSPSSIPPGAGSRKELDRKVGALLTTPAGTAELGQAVLRVLEAIDVDRSFFEATMPSGRYLNTARLQLYIIQHRLRDLLHEIEGLMRELLVETGGRVGESKVVLRTLAELYALQMGFDDYRRIRSQRKSHGLRHVHSLTPEIFPTKPSWRERRRFDKEKDRLFRLWKVVLQRYESAVRTAEGVVTSKPGSYALVVNGAYPSIFAAMLERRRISYSILEPRLSLDPEEAEAAPPIAAPIR